MAENNQVLCIDWGTSSFRAAIVSQERKSIIKSFVSDEGCSLVYQECLKSQSDPYDYFEQKLIKILGANKVNTSDFDEVIISGMASSSIGMKALPYARLPFSIHGTSLVTDTTKSSQLGKLTLISGVSADEDIMRGEETQLIGMGESLQLKEFILILPGTHSKHLSIVDHQLINFNTFLTGELFQLLSEQSVISQSLKKEPWSSNYEASFKKGVEDANKLRLLQDLFKIRARDILKKECDPGQNYFYLSGLLIGSELTSLKGSSKPKVFACDTKMQPLYEAASRQLDLSSIQFLAADLLSNSYIVGQLAMLKQR